MNRDYFFQYNATCRRARRGANVLSVVFDGGRGGSDEYNVFLAYIPQLHVGLWMNPVVGLMK